MKKYFNQGLELPLYFWRDQKGHEVDLVIDDGVKLFPIEIKFAETFSTSFTKNIDYLNNLQSSEITHKDGSIVYSGKESFQYRDINVIEWEKVWACILPSHPARVVWLFCLSPFTSLFKDDLK